MFKWYFSILVLAGIANSNRVEGNSQELFSKLSDKLNYLSNANIPLVSERYYPVFPETFDIKPIFYEDSIVPCKPGFTGEDCSIPMCVNKTVPILPHDGTAGFGDLVETDFSKTCSDEFLFTVDSFMEEFFIVISTFDEGQPSATLYNPFGVEVESCGDFTNTPNQIIHMFCNPKEVHGLGMYKIKLKATSEMPCIFEVRAPTNLTLDGGFVVDPTDDDIQHFILPIKNQGIFRFPNEYDKSYLAFKIEHEEYPVHTEKVHIYANGVHDSEYGLTVRYGCNAPHITNGTYTCVAQNLYHVKDMTPRDIDSKEFMILIVTWST
ncbi:unnamed protein product [Caenorhabditis bovis]|uniref:Irg-7 N-terminal galactose binding domain-containing protein n=1 Tax=Caenorhabditis bovis TaxID=2654633 RepID=A0A8S1EIT5_9PELO|nr:unnamed protein product [Caenorhabditis bovis]